MTLCGSIVASGNVLNQNMIVFRSKGSTFKSPTPKGEKAKQGVITGIRRRAYGDTVSVEPRRLCPD